LCFGSPYRDKEVVGVFVRFRAAIAQSGTFGAYNDWQLLC
jgi:hypothetical protein